MNAFLVVTAICLSVVYGDPTCNSVTHKTGMVDFHMGLREFIVNIEAVSTERKNVQNIKMFYSSILNITRFDIEDENSNLRIYLLFNEKEILTFHNVSGRGKCDVNNDLANSVDASMLGGVGPDTTTIPLPMAAFHFMGKSGFGGDIVHTDLGIRDWQGKQARVFTSCQKWKTPDSKNDIVLNVTHYFAAKNWKFASGLGKNTLLSIVVEGTGQVKGQNDIQVKHTYNYFNFKTHIDGIHRDSFETPDGIPCPGRKSAKPFPQAPNFMQFVTENIDHEDGTYYTLMEVYDYDSKLAIIRAPHLADTGKPTKRMTQVFDFSKDKSYTVEDFEGKCYKHLGHWTYMFVDDRYRHATMKTPELFLSEDMKNHSYLGPKRIRGLLTDTYVGHTHHFQGRYGTLQWHFAPPVSSWNNGIGKRETWAVPVKMRFWAYENHQPQHPSSTVNYFHVDYNPIRPDYIDLSHCFAYKNHFQLIFKGRKKDVTDVDIEVVKFEAIKLISYYAKVTWIHINQMKLYYIGDDIVIEFLLTGDTDLTKKTKDLTQAIKDGKVYLKVMNPRNQTLTKKLFADKVDSIYVDKDIFDPSPQKEKIKNNTGYKSGQMAGMGVGMLVLGILLGIGAGFGHTKFISPRV